MDTDYENNSITGEADEDNIEALNLFDTGFFKFEGHKGGGGNPASWLKNSDFESQLKNNSRSRKLQCQTKIMQKYKENF